MTSILDKPVSVYNGVTDRIGVTVSLECFLRSRRHRDRIIELRSETDAARRKAIKLSLPACTVSGLFSPCRKVENLVRHSGLMCIDLDGKDNPDYTVDGMRKVLCSLPYVAYASLSVGAGGMFAIIPMAYPERQKEHFAALKHEFMERFGLVLDNCGDITRLRVLSYDESAYMNGNASLYDSLYEYREQAVCPAFSGQYDDVYKVTRCVDAIEQNHIDITSSYAEWFNIGASLASLGERGRYFFHVVSRQNGKYRFSDTERKFTQLLERTSRIGLGTFFYWCRQYGITYSKQEG